MTSPTPTPIVDTPKRALYAGGKVFIKRKPITTTLMGLAASGSGDPHMILRVNGGPVLARWDDNAPGSQNTEVLFFHLKTTLDTISIFYTNIWDDPSPKIIGSVRYIHNGNEVTNFTGTVSLGPVTLTSSMYTISLSFGTVSNVVEFGGGVFIALEAAEKAGGYIDGGWGSTVDGYSVLGSTIGFSRSDIVVGQGVTVGNDYSISSQTVRNTSSPIARQVLGYLQEEFIGVKAEEKSLPLDPVALQAADIAAPGGGFDGIVNPPEITGGVIDSQGNTGPGLQFYGPDGMPSEISYVGSYQPSSTPTPTPTPTPTLTPTPTFTPTPTPTSTPTPPPTYLIM